MISFVWTVPADAHTQPQHTTRAALVFLTTTMSSSLSSYRIHTAAVAPFVFMVLLVVTGTVVSSLPTGHRHQTPPPPRMSLSPVSKELWKMWVQRGETAFSSPASRPPVSLPCPPCQGKCTISVNCRCVLDLECQESRKQSSSRNKRTAFSIPSSGRLSSGRISRKVLLRSYISPPPLLCKNKGMNQTEQPLRRCKPNRKLWKEPHDPVSILPPSIYK